MSTELDKWVESQEHQVPLDAKGKIIDYLVADTRRENTPEERIRQKMTQVLVAELGYPKSYIALERTINIGTERKRADIVVYADELACSENNQGKILLIGEVKAPSIKAPDGQGVSYISATSAQGGFWTNGSHIVFYRKEPKSGKVINWLGIPKHGHGWDSIGHLKKEDLIVPVDLKIAFKRCHNAMYRTGIDSEDVALDMVRIILAKLEDESSSKDECDFSITPDEYADAKLRNLACSRVQKLFFSVRDRFPDVFSSHEKITASDDQLAIVISHLQHYAFMDAPHDVIGTAYEVYVASHLKGERGQFFTNRLAINMMVRMLDPSEKDIILDPSCGSGGFLITAMNYVFGKIDNSSRTSNAKEVLKRNVVHQLFGIDISPKLVKIAKANMLLGKDGHGGIERGNSLDEVKKLTAKFQERAGMGMVTMILTNPPFGAGHDIRIKEPNILRHFAAGHVWNVADDGRFVIEDRLNSKVGVAPELLFLERCIEWLKPGGVLGIVMAKGQLDNREALAVRHRVINSCKILAVVNLHEDTFEPFCGSKASVIFLEKLDNMSSEDYPIFMAISNKVGQSSRGEPIFKRDQEGNPVVKNGCYVLDEDLSDIAEDYHKFKKGTLVESAFRFSTKLSDINKDTFSFNPIQYLPKHNAAFEQVLRLGESDEYELHRLGDIARVFNGPRFKRPYADLGVTEGPSIRKYFTGTALTQFNSDNIKYLDEAKASKQVLRQLDALTIYKGYILVSDSGTLGRVTYALTQHDGHVATNNLIRIVIDDIYMRGYIYQFLKSHIGQSLMLKNAYGTNQEHLEPDVIADIPIPIPRNYDVVKSIGKNVIDSIEYLEKSLTSGIDAETMLMEAISMLGDENSEVLEQKQL